MYISTIVDSLNKYGYARSNINDVPDDNVVLFFNNAKTLFIDMINSKKINELRKKIASIKNKDKLKEVAGKKKFFELTHFNLLDRGLHLDDYSIIKLYLINTFVDIAKTYLDDIEPKLFNVLPFFHIYAPYERTASQNWHIDTEDNKILKLWFYFDRVCKENGALEFVPKGSDETIRFDGDCGDILFVDTTCKHRGGYIEKVGDCRNIIQGLYIKPTARLIKTGYFSNFNYNPIINNINFNSDTFKNLTKRQQDVLL